MKLSLKKSRSLYEKKDTQRSPNPQSCEKTQRIQSHIQEMIYQKYNFSHRLKTNIYQKPKKHQSINRTSFIPNSHVIAISQLPKIQQGSHRASNQSLYESLNKIRTKQKQNSIENSGYTFVRSPPRNASDYNECIKRIQMNTTYRGFNFTRTKLNNKNRYPQVQKISVENNYDANKTPLKAAERKMIIQHIIEKGFARKMEDSLIKVRNEKKKVHYELISKRNSRPPQVMKSKRSVVFSQVESTPVCKVQTVINLDGKQHLIEPW